MRLLSFAEFTLERSEGLRTGSATILAMTEGGLTEDCHFEGFDFFFASSSCYETVEVNAVCNGVFLFIL